MENAANLSTLADTAYEAKNYEQAYQYYSRLLEADPSDELAWAVKGLSAGWTSTPDNQKLDELIVNVRQAFKNGLSASQKEWVVDEALAAARNYVKKAETSFDEGVREFDKKEIAPGVLLAVHKTGRLSYQLDHGNKQAPGWLRAIEVMEFACESAPASKRYRQTIAEIDKLLAHSKRNVNYLEAGHRQHRLLQKRQELVQKAKKLDSRFVSQPVANANGGGCFIATATLGDHDHPFVVELRNFRDEVLLRRSSGRTVVRVYYTFSPPITAFIRNRPRLRLLSLKLLIYPVVQFARKKNRARPSAT